MLKVGEIVTINNSKKYIVASTTSYEDNHYAYLVEFDNSENTKIYLVDGDNLTEVNDNALIDELENIFVNNYNL